jgi:hypothetical protein
MKTLRVQPKFQRGDVVNWVSQVPMRDPRDPVTNVKQPPALPLIWVTKRTPYMVLAVDVIQVLSEEKVNVYYRVARMEDEPGRRHPTHAPEEVLEEIEP